MLRLSLAAGLTAAVVYTVAPLSMWVIAIAAVVFALGRRGLSVGDRRVLDLLLFVAVAARLLFIVAVFLRNVPQHHDMWLGELTGDGAYGLSRGLRARDLLLGVPTSRFDSFVVNDVYGRNYYVYLLTGLQVLFGPVPYSVRVLNGLFYLAGALLLFRLTRRVYGRWPAFVALTVVLFLPSFFVWSVSLLKEPLYFLCTAIFLVAASRSLREGPVRARILAAACAVIALVVMEGVRHKTLAIGMLGWGIAASMMIVFSRPRRYLPVAALGVAAVIALLTRPAIQNRALDGLAESAKIHAGHVFTLGHGYKLLDESFYFHAQDPNSSTLTLTVDQAARYVVRAGVSFVLTPLPWQAISIRELVYVPEQLVWYALLALLPIGIVAGWHRDAATTAMMIGYLTPTSMILALTNGNVGTLVRLRGMVMVILVWVSALGLCALLERVLARASRVGVGWRQLDPGDRNVTVLDDRGRLFGRVNLVDAVVIGFIVLLIPVAYGTWLLFRPKPVRITSVTRVTLSKEEQRIANPLRAAAKLKVKGSGFTPMLRAWIGPEPSLGFTFEDPTSADVIVAPMAPGEYDVALYDGGQEVARAPKAFVNPGTPNHDQIKAVGRLVDLNRATADALQPGAMFPSTSDARVRISALGPVEPGRRPLLVHPGSERLDVPREGAFERSATLVLTCDPTNQPDTTCMVGGLYPSVNTALRVPGATDAMTFVVDELLPAAPAQPLDATVRLTGGPELAMVAVGDRDGLLDDRAAVVTAIRSRQGSSVDVQLRLGVDRARDGWRYRGRVIKAGAPFTLTTERYTAGGTVVSAVPASTSESR